MSLKDVIYSLLLFLITLAACCALRLIKKENDRLKTPTPSQLLAIRVSASGPYGSFLEIAFSFSKSPPLAKCTNPWNTLTASNGKITSFCPH